MCNCTSIATIPALTSALTSMKNFSMYVNMKHDGEMELSLKIC